MDYIYTTKGQSGREKNGTMYNGRGLGLKGIGTGQRSSVGCRRAVEGFEEASNGSKTFQRLQRRFEGCRGLQRGSKGFERGVP